jgi:hypothetical protein
MRAFCLALARFSLSAWVGAAVLFVIAGVREITSVALDPIARDQLALIRFPAYYGCGFVLLAVGLASSLPAIGHPAAGRKRAVTAAVLITAALVIFAADYQFIFRPLVAMIDPLGQPRSAEFDRLHHLSEAVNTVQLFASLAAAVLLCWPKSADVTNT